MPDLRAASPLLERIYAARGVQSAHALDRTLSVLPPPDTLKGLPEAIDLLEHALRSQWRIIIVADLDADGATSGALAVRALRSFGAAHVGYVVPNRFLHGYGLTPEIVAVAAREQPDLLVTVDNGMSGHAGVDAAHALGMRVLITDHHLPGETLPAADALVNPHQIGDAFPGKALAGVGVIFYVLSALRKRLRETGWFTTRALPEPNMADFLDLVAVGTVADVVPLAPINRILITQGLQRIRRGRCVPGIKALFTVAQRAIEQASASDIGFQIGPRLNAAGRLSDMSLSIECLLCDDPAQAMQQVEHLDRLSRDRRAIEASMQAQAIAALERLPHSTGQLPFGLCLFDPGWHQGVVGLVAGKMKERHHRPVIAFAADQEGLLRGSGRSVPGLHLRDTLAAIDVQHPGLILRFGGHAAAAGLSLHPHQLETFRTAFDQHVRDQLTAEDLQGTMWSDGALAPSDFLLETAVLLQDAGPWGQGFPEPLFDGLFTIVDQRVLKGSHVKWQLRVPDGPVVGAIAFNQADRLQPRAQQIRLAYHLEVNEWNGKRDVQLRVVHFEVA